MTIIDSPQGSHVPVPVLRAAGFGLFVAVATLGLLVSESFGLPQSWPSTAAPAVNRVFADLPAIAAAAGHHFNAVCGPGAAPAFGFAEFDRLPLQPVSPTIPSPPMAAACVLARDTSGFWALARSED